MQELTELEAYMSLPFVGQTQQFLFSGGGKQGGVETPDEWNCVIEYIMAPLVTDWCQRGYGFHLTEGDDEEEDTMLINHAVVQQDCFAKARLTNANYRLCFDGARRGSGKASAGIALLAYYEGGERELLMRAGKRLGDLQSAFLAEALAVEWALNIFWEMIVNQIQMFV
jgi:hypothetical protein